MGTILLSIKPEYAIKIINGTKKYEFRKHLAKEKIDKIILYATFPEKKIIGEVEVIGTIANKPSPLWETTKKTAGISRCKYRTYFKGCTIAYAYILGSAIKYDTPKQLSDLGLQMAPQSFVYIDDE